MSSGNSSTPPPPTDNDDSSGSLLRQTLMNVDECFLYRLPPLGSSGGHRAEQWDLANPLQTCGFQVERRNNDLYLLFTTETHSKLFALCKLNNDIPIHKSVESVVDSSRYFVTQVQAQGKSAYLGFGFRDRDVALDLIGNLQQFQKSIQREQQAKNLKVAEIPKLQEGEKMHITIGGGDKKKKKTNTTTTTSKSPGGPFLLKKPPKVETTQVGTINKTDQGKEEEEEEEEEEAIQVQMGNINLQDEHASVASSDSDVAHADGDDLDDAGTGDALGATDDEEWDDFQQA